MGRYGFLLWILNMLAAGCVMVDASTQTAARTPHPSSEPPEALIFDTETGAPVSEELLIRRAAATPWVLMGEQHDQPLHHRLRARWLRAWADAGSKSAPDARSPAGRDQAIVFEHFDREHAAALAAVQRAEPEAPLAHWLEAARFDAQGWGLDAYRPLFEAAQQSGLPWIAANLSRDEARARMRRSMQAEGSEGSRQVYGTGGEAVQAGRNGQTGEAVARRRTVPDVLEAGLARADWDEDAQRRLSDAVRAGHCHALPEAMVGPMVRVQRLRDAALAQPLLATAPGARRLLLAGNGHVNRQYGVPRYLPEVAQRLLVVGFESLPQSTQQPEGSASRHGSQDSADPVAAHRAADGKRNALLSGQTGEQRLTPLAARVGPERAAEWAHAYDLVVLTAPAPDRRDPCEAFRAKAAGAGGGGQAARGGGR